MRSFLIAALAIGAAVVATAPADARQGCGNYAHRGPHGRCISNRPLVHRGRVVRNNAHYYRYERVRTIHRSH